MLLTEGQMSDHKGAAIILPVLPDADVLIGDKGYDSDTFRAALKNRKIARCLLQNALSPAPQGRKPIRQTQGLAAHRNPL